MYVGNITLVLAFKRNSSLRPLVAKNLLAHPSKNQVQKGNKLHLVGMRMCVVRHPALSTYYVQKDILDMPACKTPDFEAAPSRVHSLKTLAYLAWIGWPKSKDHEPDNPNKSSSSPEQKPSSKEQQTSPSGAKYEGVVRHPALSTYFVHKDILRDLLAKNSEKWAPYPEAEFQFSSLT